MAVSLLFGLFCLIVCVFAVDQQEFAISALNAHNKARQAHGVPMLKLNSDLSQIAQNYAQRLANSRSTLQPSYSRFNGMQLGENLAIAYGNPSYSGLDATKLWYQGYDKYNFNNPRFDSNTGGFTQMVWQGTKHVGFGVAQAYDGTVYAVAEYYPPGNIIGQFAQNVFDREIFNSQQSSTVSTRSTTSKAPVTKSSDDYDYDYDQTTTARTRTSSSSSRKPLITNSPEDLNALRKQLADLFVNGNKILEKLNKSQDTN